MKSVATERCPVGSDRAEEDAHVVKKCRVVRPSMWSQPPGCGLIR